MILAAFFDAGINRIARPSQLALNPGRVSDLNALFPQAGFTSRAKIAPGTVVSVLGDKLSDGSETANPDAATLPTKLANTEVYFDGVRAPLMFVSPTKINAQVPFEFLDRTSISAYVRTVRSDGRISTQE